MVFKDSTGGFGRGRPGSPSRRSRAPRGQWIVAGTRRWPYRSPSRASRGVSKRYSGRWPDRPWNSCTSAASRRLDGEVPLALGVSLAARGRPDDALPLIERAVAVLRSWGQPIDLAKALLRQASVLRILGERNSSDAAVAEARSIVESCPDPGILAERLAALDRPPQMRHVRSGDQELSQRELRVLELLDGDLCEQDIGRELYVAHSTVHSHVRAIYRKLVVSTRAAPRSAAANSASSSRHPRDYAPGAACAGRRRRPGLPALLAGAGRCRDGRAGQAWPGSGFPQGIRPAGDDQSPG